MNRGSHEHRSWRVTRVRFFRTCRFYPVAVALLACLVAPATALAQPGEPRPAPGNPSDPGWELYDQAFERLLAGDRDGARDLLTRLILEFPDHPATGQAQIRLRELQQAGDAILRDTDKPGPTQPAGERPSVYARGEFAFIMTVHGTLFGRDVRQMLDGTGERSLAASLMLGGGGGLGLSLYLSRKGITQGRAQLYDSAITWGAWNALFINDGIAYEPTEAGAEVASQVGGLLLGEALWRSWRPTSGQVAMANTGGFWSLVLMALAHGVAEEEPDIRTLVLASDVGIALGGVIGTKMPNLSRGRTLLIDVGGLLGFLAGGLVAVGVAEDSSDESTAFGILFTGTAAGLLLGGYWSRNFDAPALDKNTRVGVMPMGRGGFGAILSMDLD